MNLVDVEYIRECIEEKGVTWKTVSERTGISQSALSLKMSGKCAWTLRDVVSMKDYLGCNLDRLVKP